jgi:hypothetical protein
LYFWETYAEPRHINVGATANNVDSWNCFVVGRPSSIPDPGSSIPVPSHQKLLVSLVTLSRTMSKCVQLIYSPRHDSLLPVWNAAIEIRRELHRFAEKQSKDMKFGLVGDASTGELGVCQAMVSTSKSDLRHIECRGLKMASVSSHFIVNLQTVPDFTSKIETRKCVHKRRWPE